MKARRKTRRQSEEQIEAHVKKTLERHNRNLGEWVFYVERYARNIVESSKSANAEKNFALDILGHASALRQNIEPAFNGMLIGRKWQLLLDLPALMVGSKVRNWLVWRGEPVRLSHKNDEQVLHHIGDDDEGDATPIKHLPRPTIKRLNDSLRDQGVMWTIRLNRRTGRFKVVRLSKPLQPL